MDALKIEIRESQSSRARLLALMPKTDNTSKMIKRPPGQRPRKYPRVE